MKKILLASALSLVGLLSVPAHAESQLVIGAGSAAARLNMSVVIPRVLFLGVGSGAAALGASNTAVDTVKFDYTTNPTTLGTGATAGAITNTGTFTGSAVPVRIFGNNGQIVITATNPVNLVNAATPTPDTIPFTQVTATSDNTALAHPALSGGTASPTLNTTGSNKVTSQSGLWTYAYANTVVPAAGTYTGQITYTAAMP